MERWEELFIKLNQLTGEEDFDVSEESEKSGEVWIRKQNRALAKWITQVGGLGGVYFKFITPIYEQYIYEPVFQSYKYPKTNLFYKTSNPPEGDIINCYIIINNIVSQNPIIIQPDIEYFKIDNLENYLPDVPESNEGYFISMKFTFGNNLVSQGSNMHFILE